MVSAIGSRLGSDGESQIDTRGVQTASDRSPARSRLRRLDLRGAEHCQNCTSFTSCVLSPRLTSNTSTLYIPLPFFFCVSFAAD